MTEIHYAEETDKEFWFTLDRHLSEKEFHKKVSDQMGYVLFEDGKPKGILRYNLFWDNASSNKVIQKSGFSYVGDTDIDGHTYHHYKMIKEKQ